MNQSSLEEYENLYWPQLRSALDTVLLKEPGTYQPISYEQVHSKNLSFSKAEVERNWRFLSFKLSSGVAIVMEHSEKFWGAIA